MAYPNHTVLEGVDVCLKGNDPQALLAALGGGASFGVDSTKARRFVLEHRGGMSRVHVKIAEGCDHRCSYCIVPDARGAPRSESPDSIFREVCDASEAGFEEVVLTATHVLKYGRDLSPSRSLMWLMKQLEEAVPGPRFRLSSMEPGPAMEEVVGHLLESPRWCRHLHLAIQNGSDGVLARMRRPYRFETVERELERLSGRDPALGVGMDVIVGFPGETDAEFQENLERLQGLPFHYLHVFPYSPRKGTEAASMRPLVPSQIVKTRSALLRELSQQRRREFAEGFVGKEMEVLVETVLPNRFTGITDNYLRVTGSGSNLKKGKLAKVLVRKAIDGVLWVNQPWEEERP